MDSLCDLPSQFENSFLIPQDAYRSGINPSLWVAKPNPSLLGNLLESLASGFVENANPSALLPPDPLTNVRRWHLFKGEAGLLSAFPYMELPKELSMISAVFRCDFFDILWNIENLYSVTVFPSVLDLRKGKFREDLQMEPCVKIFHAKFLEVSRAVPWES